MSRAELVVFITRKSAYIPLLLLLSIMALVAGLLTGIQHGKSTPLQAVTTRYVSPATPFPQSSNGAAGTPVSVGQIHVPSSITSPTPTAGVTAPPAASATGSTSTSTSTSVAIIASVASGTPPAPGSTATPETPNASPAPSAGASPVITPAQQPKTSPVYDGALADGWSAYPYKSTLNLSAGQGFMAWNAGIAGNIALIDSQPLDVTPYRYLSFQVKAGQTQGKYAIQLSGASGQTLTGDVDLDAYGTFEQGTITLFKIPLSALGASGQSIHQISFQNTSGAAGQIISLSAITFTS